MRPPAARGAALPAGVFLALLGSCAAADSAATQPSATQPSATQPSATQPSAADRCEPLVLDGRPSPRWVDVPGAHSAAVFVAGAERPVAGSLAPARPLGAGVARRFRPAFAFAPGLTYEVRTARCRASFAVPRLEAAAPRVMAVYPRSPSIPENVLRFYVTFSEPMADAASSVPIRLLREGGEDLSGVFFRPDEALWSADRRRLTLLVDPGRVKTGLRAHRTLGRAFVAGERYRLEVRAGWPSLAGKPLETPFVHRFVATPEDRAKVDPARWCVRTTEGAAGARLTVGFGEPVDHASVQRLLRVANADDVLVPGSWTLGAGDAQARWTPAEPLGAAFGSHRLLVGARFEDVAGNDLRAAFDHGVGAGRHAPELVTRSLRAAGVAGGAEPCDESLHEPRR